MAVPFPQHDKPAGLSGGADLWDTLAGEIILLDYFPEADDPPDPPDPPDPSAGGELYYLARRRRNR